MDRSSAVLLTAFTGGLIALQAPLNAMLGGRVGSFQSALVNFVVGTAALCLIVAFARGGFGGLAGVKGAPWHYFVGGLLGAAYVTSVLVTVKYLGAGGVTAATISGQLTMSVIVDQFGWLGVEKDPVSAPKVIGLVLLAAGTFLIVRE